jgi:uncharacterized membrane protein
MDVSSYESSWPLRRSALLGAAAGLRSQMPFAVVANAVSRGDVQIDHDWIDGWLRDPRVVQLATLSAIGELVIDKLPFIPARTDVAQFAGRLLFGALAGMLGARHDDLSLSAGATAGALAAGISATIGTTIRQAVPEFTDLPGLTIAIVEDVIAFLIASEGIRPETSQSPGTIPVSSSNAG